MNANGRITVFFLILLFVIGFIAGYMTYGKLAPQDNNGSTEPEVNVSVRDTTIYNYDYRDTTVYDYNAVPVTLFDTVTEHDTTYILVPISSYHFGIDSVADIYVSGYGVTLDSTRFDIREIHTTEFRDVMVSRPNLVGVELGINEVSLLYVRDFGRVSLGFRAGYTFDRRAMAGAFVGMNF